MIARRHDHLLERELTARAIGVGYEFSSEVVCAKTNTSAFFPLLGKGWVTVVSGVIGAGRGRTNRHQ